MKPTKSECYEQHKKKGEWECKLNKAIRFPLRRWRCVLCDSLDMHSGVGMMLSDILKLLTDCHRRKLTREETETEFVLQFLKGED